MMLSLRTNVKSMYQYLLLLPFMLMHNSLSAQITVKPERANTRYELGETANFRVTGAANGTVSYQIKHTLIDSLPLLASGTAQVVNGVATISYSAREAVFLTCKVFQDTNTVHTAATFSIEKLQPLEEEPADFDAFWAAQKAAVKAVPMDVNLTYIRTSTYSNVFSFDIAITDGKRAYGYLVVPISLVGSYPAIILMPSFGATANVVTDDVAAAERAGVLSVFLSPHNNPPNISSGLDDYLTDGIATPQTYYLKYVLLGAVKTIDYLQTRPDFNGQVGTMGTSQGGGLSALIAGIDNRVGLLASSYPSFCHQAAAKYSKPSAFPYTYNTAYLATGANRAIVLSTVKYYDPVYALRRFKGVSYNATSLKDFVCPPQAVTTALNQTKGQKINVIIFDKQHTEGPDEFFNSSLNNSIYAFFRRHFPACRQAPWPYNPPTLGYVINAGKDTLLMGTVLNLTGFVGVNDTAAASFPVKWEKIDGAGDVVFSNATNRTTTATFSQSGVYRLRFYGYDYSTVNDNKYFVLSNDIVVTVNSLIPVELKSFSGKVLDKTNELTWVTVSEINNSGFEIERSEDTNRWQRLDFVKGKGNSSQVNKYSFTDNAPLSINYYRLRQIDVDGKFRYSNTISLIRPKINGVQIFPNPAADILTIRMDNKDNSDIKIYDILGRIVFVNNTKTNETPLNISQLAKGAYFIEIKNGPLITIRKFIKS
jgi:cephalosporin-C deacetylase